jgi:hypothetical protein
MEVSVIMPPDPALKSNYYHRVIEIYIYTYNIYYNLRWGLKSPGAEEGNYWAGG